MKKIMNLVIAGILFGSCGALLLAVNNKNVLVGGTNTPEQVDIDEEDPVTRSEFTELIGVKQGSNKPYIIARVASQDAKGRRYIRYFDADALNAWLFKEGFWGHTFKQLDQYKDPMNSTPIVSIDYFTINNLGDTVFTYLCSFNDIANNVGESRAYFDANQQARELSGKELINQGKNYYYGSQNTGEAIPVDYPRAINFFERAANQQGDQWSRAVAHEMLGDIYKQGNGTAQNQVRADQYYRDAINIFTQLANQRNDPEEASRAKYRLGMLYYLENYGLVQDFARARDYLTEVVAAQLVGYSIMTDVKYTLGNIYFNGGHGVDRDLARAREYFTQVANQEEDRSLVEFAQLRLGDIYSTGGDGIDRDLARAREYYNDASKNEF